MANQCKYYKVVRQVSYDSGVTWVNIGETQKGDLYEYDSAECGAVTQYRWVDVTGQYTCEGTTKFQKTKKQYSTDGTTWQDVSPAEYGKGNVIEYQSSDCGYVPPAPSSGSYLTFVALEDGRFKPKLYGTGDIIQYSLDGGSTWSTLASDTYSPTVYNGQEIKWKSNKTGYIRFSSTGRFNVEGNIMSLLYGDNFEGNISLGGAEDVFASVFYNCTGLISAENLVLPATALTNHCYSNMFANCTSLTATPSLPATTLAEWCYAYMFQGCTSLATAPSLPATTLAKGCYYLMFDGCTSLTTTPSLPATTLAEECYSEMFYNCTSLTTAPNTLPATTLAVKCYFNMFGNCTSLATAPELPATTLADYCYYTMFYGCTSLNYIKCLATNISAEECTRNWVSGGVPSTGTFVKNSSMSSWTTGANGIPTNWTVQNA